MNYSQACDTGKLDELFTNTIHKCLIEMLHNKNS